MLVGPCAQDLRLAASLSALGVRAVRVRRFRHIAGHCVVLGMCGEGGGVHQTPKLVLSNSGYSLVVR